MNRTTGFKLVLILAIICFACSSCGDDNNPVKSGNPVMSVYLDFYHYLDLDSGLIDSSSIIGIPDTSVDFWIAYNSNSPDFHGAIFHRFGRETAVLDSAQFNNITAMMVDSSTFNTTLQSDPFDTTRVFLLKTDLGAIYKIGNPVEILTGVTFDYSLVKAAP